jgi:hypothetical protein
MENYFLVSLIGGLSGLGYSLMQNQLIPLVCLFCTGKTEAEAEVFLSLASQFGFDLGTSGGGAFTGSN